MALDQQNPEDPGGDRGRYIRVDVNDPLFWLVAAGTAILLCLDVWLVFFV
jgi:hypothetical protein